MSATDMLKDMYVKSLTELINNRNALVQKINAATGDEDSLTDSIYNSDQFEAQRVQIAELQDALDAAVATLVKEALAGATEDVEALRAEVKEIDGALSPGLTYLKKAYGEEVLETMPDRERLKGVRTGGGGGGGRRIRGYNWVVTIDGDATEYESAAHVAKLFGLETPQIQEQFFAKAGVESLKDAPNEVVLTLNFVSTDKDGAQTPKVAEIKAYRTTPVETNVEADPADAPVEPEPEFTEEFNEADLAEF